MKNKNKQKSTKLDKVLQEQGYIIYPIKGISMLPLLIEGEDTVKIEKVGNDELEIYDVALYYNNSNSYTLHRVIDKDKKYYYIVGDNCNTLERVKKNLVIGKMVGFFKKKRWVSVLDQEYLDYINNNIKNVDIKMRTKLYPKISNEWKVIFALINASVNDTDVNYNDIDCDLKNDIDWTYIYKFSKHHSITSLLAYKIDKDIVGEDIYNCFLNASNANLKKTILFNAERNRIVKKLEENNFEYIYLKGILTNELYPKIGLREFADNDLLIRDKETEKLDFKKLYKMMQDLDYSPASLHGVHDSYHKEPCYNFEFHRALFDKGYKFSSYFNNIWKMAYKDQNNDFLLYMTKEDIFVYNLAHFYKHYNHGGAGIRSFIDMYVIDKKYKNDEDFNINKKNELIKRLGLYEFEKEIFDLIDKMFLHTKDLNYQEILYIMESGTYGLVSHDVSNKLDNVKGNKIKYVLKRIFIPYRSMKSMYPVLRYLPILLPLFWVVRLFKLVFKKETRKNFKAEVNAMKKYKK